MPRKFAQNCAHPEAELRPLTRPMGVPFFPPPALVSSRQARIPQRIIEEAVWGMLPKGRLGAEIYGHLKARSPSRPGDRS